MDITSGSLQLPGGGGIFNLSVSALGTGGLINDFRTMGNYSWTIASAIGGITGFVGTTFDISLANALLYTTDNGNGTWFMSLGDGGNALFLNYAYAPVPEPSTYAAFGVAICGALVYLRRRQRARQTAAATVTTV